MQSFKEIWKTQKNTTHDLLIKVQCFKNIFVYFILDLFLLKIELTFREVHKPVQWIIIKQTLTWPPARSKSSLNTCPPPSQLLPSCWVAALLTGAQWDFLTFLCSFTVWMQPWTAWWGSRLSLSLDGILLCIIAFPSLLCLSVWSLMLGEAVLHSFFLLMRWRPVVISPSAFNGPLGCFRIGALVQSAAMNIWGLVFWPTCVQVSLEHMPGSAAAESQDAWPHLSSPAQLFSKVLLSVFTPFTAFESSCCFAFLLTFAYWHLCVFWIFISLMTREVETTSHRFKGCLDFFFQKVPCSRVLPILGKIGLCDFGVWRLLNDLFYIFISFDGFMDSKPFLPFHGLSFHSL